MKRFLACILLVMLPLGLFGCGNDNPGSNGQLAVSASPETMGGNLASFVVTATYSMPPLGTPTSTPINSAPPTNVAGVPITFTASIYTSTGALQRTFTDTVPTDALGVATNPYLIQQQNQTQFVNITVSTGGLSETTSVVVPSL